MNRYLIVDGNSIAHAANAGTPLNVGQTEVQAIYGVMRTMRSKVAIYAGHKPIVLWDGASWRKNQFADYKANRDKKDSIHEKRQALLKDSLKRQTPAIRKGLTLLGIDQIIASNMEADDLAGILVDRFSSRGDKSILLTADGDWIQLVDDNTIWIDPIHDRKVTAATFLEKTGVKSPRHFVELKALIGDVSDNVPGVGGIGEKGAKEFLATYDSVANFKNAYLDGTLDQKKLPKKFRDLCDDENKLVAFGLNIDLMDLKSKRRPKPEGMTVTAGATDIQRFREFCDRLMFRSITQDLENWLGVFPSYKHAMEAA